MCRAVGCSPAALQSASYKVTACWSALHWINLWFILNGWTTMDYNVECYVNFICRTVISEHLPSYFALCSFCAVSKCLITNFPTTLTLKELHCLWWEMLAKGYFRASLNLFFKDPHGNWFQYVPESPLPHLTLKENSLACIISGICCTNDTVHTKQLRVQVSAAVVGLLKQKAQNGM